MGKEKVMETGESTQGPSTESEANMAKIVDRVRWLICGYLLQCPYDSSYVQYSIIKNNKKF